MSVGSGVGQKHDGFADCHRFLLILIWAQIPALAVVGLLVGEPLYEVALASLILTAFALGGSVLGSRSPASVTVALGLLTSSAILIHYADGADYAHFHFFLMIAAISFYRLLLPLVVGVVDIVAYHLLATVASPSDTLSWAVVHSGAIIALSLLFVIGWRLQSGVAVTPGLHGDRFRLSFVGAPIGMGVLKPSGEIVEANRAMESILGYEQGSLAGVNISSLVHPDDQVDLGDAWEQIGNDETHSAAFWMRCLTGTGQPIWGRISLSLVPRSADQAATVILQMEDSTRSFEEQRHLEAMLRGKDEFVAAVGDEIKQPLGMLIDLTDAAERSHIDYRETLPRIEAHARQIASIVDDLVVSARADTSPVTVVSHRLDAAAICRETVSGFSKADDIALDFQAFEMWGDHGLTRQIVNGLVGNAVRYGGPNIALRTIRSGPDTVIQVIDDGPAIPESERKRLFNGDLRSGEPVTRPAAVGLSLTVGRHLARLMDGDVEYRRTPDGENLFELRLPSEQINEIPHRIPA